MTGRAAPDTHADDVKRRELRAAVEDMPCECRREHLAALDRLVAEITRLEIERDEALKRVTNWEHAQLAADAFAGQEHRRAEAAERERDKLKDALREIAELDDHMRYGHQTLNGAVRLARAALAAAAETTPAAVPVEQGTGE